MPRFSRLAFRPPRPPRLSVKAMMGIVGLVALTFGLATELINRQGRDRHAGREATALAWAAWHDGRLAECAAALAANRPYSYRDRVQVERRGVRTVGVEDYTVALTGWIAERDYHRRQAERLAAEAAEAATQKQYYQRRLLVPF